jgi:hypothetical protein
MQLPLWMDYYVNTRPAFTGDITAGSDILTHVQGEFPAVGERPDMPMLPAGAYVTAIDPPGKNIHFSMSNNSGRSYTDYTCINGYPAVEMHSAYDLPYLQKYGKTLIGGADFYLHDLINKNNHESAYLLGSSSSVRYRNFNTLIGGDTSLHKLKYLILSTPNEMPAHAAIPPVHPN